MAARAAARAAAARAAARAPPPPRRALAAATADQRRRVSAGGEPSSSSVPPHVPVLLDAVLAAFAPLPSLRAYVDCTLGAGGHAAAVAAAHQGRLQRLIGLDVDPAARALATARLAPLAAAGGWSLHVVPANFRALASVLAGGHPGAEPTPLPADPVAPDAILIDCGFSSMQIDDPTRGLSFAGDGPLDMRLGGAAQGGATAADVVNMWPEASLASLFRDAGGERHARLAARRVVGARPLATTGDLVAAVGALGPPPRGGGRRAVHPATRVFQALRIAVNDEGGALDAVLPAALDALAPGGRVGVISFHSGEDGAVKRALAAAAGRPPPPPESGSTYDPLARLAPPPPPPLAVGRVVTRRPVVPTDAEAAANPRARSAKLRVFEKFSDEEAGEARAAWERQRERGRW